MEFLEKLYIRIDLFNEAVGKTVSWLSLAMAIITFCIVILRYVFNSGWIWVQESVTAMHGALFLVAAGYTLLHEGHVRVDVFYRPMSPVNKAKMDIAGVLFLLLPTCFLIFYTAWPYVVDSWEVLEDSKEAGGLPGVYLLKSLILVFPLLLGIQGISLAIKSFLIMKGKIEPAQAEDHII